MKRSIVGAVAVLITATGFLVNNNVTGSSITFDGTPPAPLNYSNPHLDIQTHYRGPVDWYSLPPMQADHGADCSAPPATHITDNTYGGAFFQCKDHVMTMLDSAADDPSGGYAALYMTPDQMVDFSNGPAVIQWDMSTMRYSGRDWADIWVTPYADNLALPLEDWLPDLQGYPKNAVTLRMNLGTPTSWVAEVFQNYKQADYGDGWTAYSDANITASNQAATRQTFKLTLSKTHIRFEMLPSSTAQGAVFVDQNIPALNFDKGIVQFGHHSYNPTKDGAGSPGTWHWDNFSISPSVPFTMVKGLTRYVDPESPVMEFAAPAPANAYLRFAGVGTISLSFDGGKTWQKATPARASGERNGGNAGHASSYFVPIPQGTQTVKFKFTKRGGWYDGPFIAQDMSIWSLNTSPVTQTPIPSPSPSLTPTPTSIPTATATSTPPPTVSSNRVRYLGEDWYIQGANLPWYNWGCDFGCGTNGGVSDTSVQNALKPVLSQAKANGFNVIRWWLFPGSPWQIDINNGIDSAVYGDIDAALALAEQYDLYYDFTLFSAPSALPQSWLTNTTQRAKLASIIGQLAAHYKDNSRIMTWDIINEPEWDIWNGAAPEQATVDTVTAIVSAIHASGSHSLVTVGSAMLDGLYYWTNSELDYYDAHWYDYMSGGNYCARCADYATQNSRWGLNNKPLIIGETYAGTDTDALARFNDFYNMGYAGVLAWSLFPSKTSDGMGIDMNAGRTFASTHSGLGPTGTITPPIPTPTPMPTRTITPAATNTPTPSATVAPVYRCQVQSGSSWVTVWTGSGGSCP